MSRPEFDYTPSWLERALEWIAEQLSKLFEPGDPTTGGSTFGGGIGALLGWLLILAAVVALIAIVVWVVMNRTRRERRPEEEPLTLTEIAQRLQRTPGSTKDYLSWLEDVDLIVSRQKRYSYTDPLLRLWVRLHCRPVPPSVDEVAHEVQAYAAGRLPETEPAAVARFAGDRRAVGIIEID